ncbi:MAG: hypothetical protein O9253_02460 [Aquidulcibacter sp.]|jgi:hypothetical protein|nr:hypothetical protein [Aquidulcibacter sp.]
MEREIRGIPEELKILIGRPAMQPEETLRVMLRQVVDQVPGCLEAHLPQVFAVGKMPAPRLALVVVIDPAQDPEPIAERLNKDVLASLPAGTSLDVWALMPSDHLLPAVRNARVAL